VQTVWARPGPLLTVKEPLLGFLSAVSSSNFEKRERKKKSNRFWRSRSWALWVCEQWNHLCVCVCVCVCVYVSVCVCMCLWAVESFTPILGLFYSYIGSLLPPTPILGLFHPYTLYEVSFTPVLSVKILDNWDNFWHFSFFDNFYISNSNWSKFSTLIVLGYLQHSDTRELIFFWEFVPCRTLIAPQDFLLNCTLADIFKSQWPHTFKFRILIFRVNGLGSCFEGFYSLWFIYIFDWFF